MFLLHCLYRKFNMKGLYIILVLLCCYRTSGQDTKICTTPSGKTGICKSILDCPFLKELAMKENILKQEVYYLRRSSCGFNKSVPLVCCPKYGPETCTPTAQPPDPWSGCCGRARTRRYKLGTSFPEMDQYPWMALIEYERHKTIEILCSATLISSKYLLTTALCTTERTVIPRRVRLGEYNIASNGPDCEETSDGDLLCNAGAITVPIESIVVHPLFNTFREMFDISLIRLSEMVPYSDFIRPICLPTVDVTVEPPRSLRLYVAGWGATESGRTSDILRHVGLPLVSLEKCKKSYNDRFLKISEGHICAGSAGRDSCRGDTGAPLMYDTGVFEEVVGLVSFGPNPCGRPNFPGVYTKVYFHYAWIRENILP